MIVYQGESEQVQDCLLVGQFVLSALPAGRAADMPVDVTIICNENGIVEVKAVDVSTQKEAKITVDYSQLRDKDGT